MRVVNVRTQFLCPLAAIAVKEREESAPPHAGATLLVHAVHGTLAPLFSTNSASDPKWLSLPSEEEQGHALVS